MQTAKLKTFAQYARRALRKIVDDKIKFVSDPQSPARRDHPKAVTELEDRIKAHGKEAVIEKAAYIWFNRFCALRFMDMNRYNRVGVLSPLEKQSQPEILAEAKMGVMDAAMIPAAAQNRIAALLSDKIPSPDPQNEAYRLLIVAVCNYWNKAMPFLFERIADYTELLMPDDLLSDNSIAIHIREAMTTDACADVEVIGWLYQFYISEKKDEVFAGLKKNRKVTPENIPAATQLFTPNWIVRYLVENSLGRLWMLNRPGSALIEKMAYYIKPEQEETDFLKISSPEEIKICDPACGSGHILVYAFEILYAVYEEEGYDAPEIPHLILKNNLYGVEIDERAGVLAAFALFMKAREKYRRFFRKSTAPNICVLEKINLGTTKNTKGGLFETANEHRWTQIVDRLCLTGADREALLHDLRLFEEADNFGSLLKPELSADDIDKLIPAARDMEEMYLDDVFLNSVTKDVSKALKQADYLSPEYHVVIANPPYMGGKGMNPRLKTFLQKNYKDVKSDLFSAFMVRNTELALPKGQLGFMSPFVWMFISSYQKLRTFLINQKTVTSLVQLEYSGFDGATVPICTFTIENAHHPDFKGGYVRLSDFRGSENQGPKTLEAVKNPDCGWFFRASAVDFNKIPGSPIAYWVSEKVINIFASSVPLDALSRPRVGMSTSDTARFVKRWYEINLLKIGFEYNSLSEARESKRKWFPFNKGGEFRKWYGNNEFVVNWENDGEELKHWLVNNPNDPTTTSYSRYIRSPNFYFMPSITWSKISSSKFSVRLSEKGFIFSDASNGAFPEKKYILFFTGYLNSKFVSICLEILSPTLNFKSGDIAKLPILYEANKLIKEEADKIIKRVVTIAKTDWNSYETSWNFTNLPLLQPDYHQPTLKETYTRLRTCWQKTTLEMQRLEEENNRIFIEAYGLQEELTPDVPLSEITLTCNPHYRYGGKK
ncbi:BREX-1 system adenine-specific DNA-methyltransferase PglX, partial [Desulfococcaceae bacterium HSG9]|nr:BREX-1 system adenine-specific DNA-methyltransferase PglX [Desulfococcaceae bacterium HSG9]